MKILFQIFYFVVFTLAIFFTFKREKYNHIIPKPIKINIKTIVIIVLMVFASRIFLYYIDWLFTHLFGAPRSFLEVWRHWDANGYLRIANYGYYDYTEGWISIVFFPLYPTVVWLFKFVFINDYISALIVSWTCLSLACIYLYKLILVDNDHKTGMRAIKYLLIFPATVFLGAPYTESMFLLFCFGCMYYTRLQNYSRACIFGLLAALTRNVGVLLVLFVFIEILYNNRYKIKPSIKQFPYLLLIPLGTIIYLAIGQLAIGDPLAFLVFQREWWCQEFGDCVNTLSTTFCYMTTSTETSSVLLLWMNQFITLIVSGITLPLLCKKTRTSYGAYSIVYIFIIFSPTWLLSGLRYYMGMATLYPALATATRRKWIDICLTVLFIALAITLSCFYSIQWDVL